MRFSSVNSTAIDFEDSYYLVVIMNVSSLCKIRTSYALLHQVYRDLRWRRYSKSTRLCVCAQGLIDKTSPRFAKIVHPTKQRLRDRNVGLVRLARVTKLK
jgi:hypothetical protein